MVAAGSYAGRGMSAHVANTTCWPIHPQFARPGGPFLTSTTTHIGSSYQARGCTPAMRRNVERVDSISAIQNTAGLPYCLPGPLLDQPRYWELLRGLAPAGLELPRRRTCAVVGSSGWMNGSALGPLIDSHDVVIRINRAPARGSAYEADVGRRTTIRVLDPVSKYDFDPDVLDDDSEHLLFSFAHPFTVDRLHSTVLQSTNAAPWNFSGWSPRPSAIPPLPSFAKQRPLRMNASNVALINPELILWALLVEHGGTWGHSRKKAIRPTTGMVSVMVALHLCERTNLFGFSWGSGDRRERAHYYAMLPPYNRDGHLADTYHDPRAEFSLLRTLAAARVVGWFPDPPPPGPREVSRWRECTWEMAHPLWEQKPELAHPEEQREGGADESHRHHRAEPRHR